MKRAGIILLIILIPVLLFSEEYSYRTSDILRLMDSEYLRKSTYSFDGLYYKGCSLLETLPLMEEVYEMDIRNAGSKNLLKNDDLGEYWAEALLVSEDNSSGLSLIFKDRIYHDLTQLNFKGTAMESDELEVWLSWEGVDALKDEIENFADHHNISIKAVEVPSPDSKLHSVVRARGDVPDLVMIQSSAVEKLVSARAVQNLGYIKTPDLIIQGTEAFTLNNKLWALPFYFDTQLIYYNRNLLDSVPSPDWTLNDMELAARQIRERNNKIHPLAWNAYSSNWLIPFQVSFGKGELIDSKGIITVNDKATEEALNYILDLKEEKLLSPLERDAMDALFIAGKVGMIMSGSYAVPYFESLGLEFGVLPYPINQMTGIPLSPLLDFKSFCMTRQTKHPILARRFLQHMIGAGVQQRFCPALAKLPARVDVLDIPGISYGYLSLLKSTVVRGTVVPPQQIYSIYKNNMWKLLRFALSGQLSVHQTLEKGQTLMNNSIKN
ncbi:MULTISPECIES: extracellular solute-binding protein [unclassified Oceanispirochaeta]|uniref:sugar ABC transporter substrate-binding protein n=1 Tax=unclassified Oceanispirochaeta TaxID=2635722 RepID=UPI000E098803|nr:MULTISPECIES: extracellular solute-binding protein [unclassified Oceanispirochaeta]MBF9014503.1 extracellular solute-binding protein [Oceanispirochaeta sp. M2]NPD70759.1 extracellular solute-binding protein [Oceanispirochaeta sp. M1]RDG34040.1 extracellular solute-binding protein [Oceanispirochaeta sp. M1]